MNRTSRLLPIIFSIAVLCCTLTHLYNQTSKVKAGSAQLEDEITAKLKIEEENSSRLATELASTNMHLAGMTAAKEAHEAAQGNVSLKLAEALRQLQKADEKYDLLQVELQKALNQMESTMAENKSRQDPGLSITWLLTKPGFLSSSCLTMLLTIIVGSIQALARKLSKAEKSREEIEHNLKALTAMYGEMQNKMETKHQLAEKTAHQLQAALALSKQAAEAGKAMDLETDAREQRINALLANKQDAESQIRDLTAQVAKAKSALCHVEDRTMSKDAEVQDLHDQVEKAKHALSIASGTAEAQEKAIERLHEQWCGANTKLEMANAELQSAKSEATYKIQAVMDHMRNTKIKFSQKLSKSKQECSNLRRQLESVSPSSGVAGLMIEAC